MQYLFYTDKPPEVYSAELPPQDDSLYPPPLLKCPHRDCHMPVRLEKHGYYKRWLVTETFQGRIRIRRYVCPVCGKTVSVMPAFCIPYFQYGTAVIVNSVWSSFESGSVMQAAREWSQQVPGITRRHITYYRGRMCKNRQFIQYGINAMPPAPVELGRIPGDIEWTKRFLCEIRPQNILTFNADFQNTTRSSFMSYHNMVA